jgi:hypothetical protein
MFTTAMFKLAAVSACDAVYSGNSLPTFRRKLLGLSSLGKYSPEHA